MRPKHGTPPLPRPGMLRHLQKGRAAGTADTRILPPTHPPTSRNTTRWFMLMEWVVAQAAASVTAWMEPA